MEVVFTVCGIFSIFNLSFWKGGTFNFRQTRKECVQPELNVRFSIFENCKGYQKTRTTHSRSHLQILVGVDELFTLKGLE